MTELPQPAPTEREQVNREMNGVSALLILGGDIRSQLTDTDKTTITRISQGEAPIPSDKITARSQDEREAYWQGKSDDEAMNTWRADFNNFLNQYQGRDEEIFLKGIGITIDSGADGVYQKFMVDGDGDVTKYVQEILSTHSAEDIRNNMDLLVTVGNIYGENSAKITGLLTEGMLQAKTDPNKFVQAAETQLQQGGNMPGYDLLTWLNQPTRRRTQEPEPVIPPPAQEEPPLPPQTPQPERTRQRTEQSPGEPITNLTPELARDDPERFKNILLANLGEHTTYAGQAWEYCVREGLVSPDHLYIDSSTWASRSGQGQEISLGTQKLSTEASEGLFFEDQTFDYPRQIVHRITHEFTHKLSANKLSHAPEYANLYQIMYNSRSQNGERGFSTLGNLEHYANQSIDQQTNEDMIELVTMYLTDPDYLKRYLTFLTEPAWAEERTKRGLFTLEPDSANNLFNIVDTTVKNTLGIPEERTDPPQELTQELARSEPEKFKTELINRVQEQTVFGKQVWEFLTTKAGFSLENITINPDSAGSHSDGDGPINTIKLGAQPLDAEGRKKLLLNGEHFTYEHEMLYKTMHEFSHQISSELIQDPTYDEARHNIWNTRSHTENLGLTPIGSQEIYQRESPEVQANEDMIELSQMYLTDPAYLKTYLQFLVEPQYAQQRRDLKLMTLSQGAVNELFGVIEKTCQSKLNLPEQTQQQVRLTPELAKSNPELYEQLLLTHLEQKSQYGAKVWNLSIERGILNPQEFTLDNNTWVSTNRKSNGKITIGTAPMDAATKERLFFQDTNFSYEDEVAYRLNHELAHDLFRLTETSNEMRTLQQMAADARDGYPNNQRGLTALGSLDFYRERDTKVREDTTELMAMYLWNPQYLRDYLQFLGNANESTRTQRGLAILQEPDAVFNAVRDLVEGTLRE